MCEEKSCVSIHLIYTYPINLKIKTTFKISITYAYFFKFQRVTQVQTL